MKQLFTSDFITMLLTLYIVIGLWLYSRNHRPYSILFWLIMIIYEFFKYIISLFEYRDHTLDSDKGFGS